MSKKTSIGGQALMEGVMMLGPDKITAAFCDSKGNVTSEDIEFHFMREKYPVLGKPFLRGIFNFIDTMRLSMKSMEMATDRIEITDEDDKEESKIDKFLNEKVGDKLTGIIMGIATVFALILSVGLFVFLPIIAISGLKLIFGENIETYRSLIEGMLRLVIFVAYVFGISLIPDIKRVFMYHGAEHKTIFCYENELPLTIENVRKQTRFHPRCGTSFLVIMIVLGIIIGFFIPFTNPIIRTGVKLLTLPVVVSIGYELIKICGKYENVVTKLIAIPGLWVQRITTKEPDDKMIETAIMAMEAVIPENGEDIIE